MVWHIASVGVLRVGSPICGLNERKLMNGYVADGYTLDGYIAEAPAGRNGERLYEALEFTYRPAVRIDIIRLDSEVRICLADEETNAECSVKAEMLACAFVAKRMNRWNLKDHTGKPIPLTSDSLARLNAQLFASLYRIIRGTQLSDPKPSETMPPMSDEEMTKN